MTSPKALDGIRVLDLTRVLAGPYCSMLLGDLGADIVKVERPGAGDDTRHWGPPWLGDFSAYFLSVNRNKRSLTLDLKHPEGQRLLRQLLSEADILLENFRVGTLARWGLDPETLEQEYPSLIVCRFSGYGQEGEEATRPGYDFAVQAEAGVMSITGERDGSPMKVGVAVVDVTAGLYASQAILAALHYRHRSGKGQIIDVALWDAQLGWLVNVAQNALVTGLPSPRFGNEHPNIVPYQTFATATEEFAVAVGNDNQYRKFCEALEAPALWENEDYKTNAGRVEHREVLIPVIQSYMSRKPASHWKEALLQRGIPCAPIQNVLDALHAPQSQQGQMVQEIPHPTLGAIPQVGPVAKLSRTPAQLKLPPPALGEHTVEVLQDWLGLSMDEIQFFQQKNVL